MECNKTHLPGLFVQILQNNFLKENKTRKAIVNYSNIQIFV